MTFTYAKNASKLHRKIGDILSSSSPWKGFKVSQEVLVRDLFPSWGSGTERYDWVIRDLFTVIEAHGVQHFRVSTFGQEAGEAIMNFQAQQSRDDRKQEVADQHNWTYIMIPYSDERKLDANYLKDVYEKANCNAAPVIPEKSEDKFEEARKQRLALAKQYRREQYARQKEYKEKLKKR